MLVSGRVLDLIDIWSPIFFEKQIVRHPSVAATWKWLTPVLTEGAGGKNTKPELKGFQISLSRKSHETCFCPRPIRWWKKHQTTQLRDVFLSKIEWQKRCMDLWFGVYTHWTSFMMFHVHLPSQVSTIYYLIVYNHTTIPPVQSTQLTTNWQLFVFNNSAPTLKSF